MPDELPVDEKAPFKAESPYGETKQICEKILNNEKINHISLRYFNQGSVNLHLLEFSNDKASNLIPIITETAIEEKLNIWK